MATWERIIAAVGSQKELARSLGVTQMAVTHYKTRGIPAGRVLAIERATGGQVTRYEMRPDIYPIERVQQGAAA